MPTDFARQHEDNHLTPVRPLSPTTAAFAPRSVACAAGDRRTWKPSQAAPPPSVQHRSERDLDEGPEARGDHAGRHERDGGFGDRADLGTMIGRERRTKRCITGRLIGRLAQLYSAVYNALVFPAFQQEKPGHLPTVIRFGRQAKYRRPSATDRSAFFPSL